MAGRGNDLARRISDMVRKFIAMLAIMCMVFFTQTAIAAEFDANEDDIFDDQYKFSAENITVGTLGLTQGGCNLDISLYEGIIAITGGACYELNSATELETAAVISPFLSIYVRQSDCSTIDGDPIIYCTDSDDNVMYYWDGDSVEVYAGQDLVSEFLKANGLRVETALTAEPANEHLGQIVLADNDTWDPADVPGTTPYWAICTATGTPGTWVAFLSSAGSLIVSGIDLPTLEEDELNDDTGDRLLTSSELKNKVISNGGLTALQNYDFPAREEGWNFIVVIEAAYDVILRPNGTEQWYLNGTQVSAGGDEIRNTADTVGESISCYSTERAVYCESKYSNWVEE
jgi:hypothetical protein